LGFNWGTAGVGSIAYIIGTQIDQLRKILGRNQQAFRSVTQMPTKLKEKLFD